MNGDRFGRKHQPQRDAAPAVSASPFNSPLEVGVRVLMILVEGYPRSLDINSLVLLDHGVLHSADLGGPDSLHPPLPIRAGELGVKRETIEAGLELMLRVGLAEMSASAGGVEFRAGDEALNFIRILDSRYARALHDRVVWVVQRFDDLSDNVLRRQMRAVFDSWSEEFHTPTGAHTDERGTR
ncbi:ABC-three component system middle component 2 [Nocardia elegans]|uniref:ABC-three component system middle component 2 n=1 Tax=Nocardia elegans TaxID=300029 RepID=A0ABW6TMG7_9NOCA